MPKVSGISISRSRHRKKFLQRIQLLVKKKTLQVVILRNNWKRLALCFFPIQQYFKSAEVFCSTVSTRMTVLMYLSFMSLSLAQSVKIASWFYAILLLFCITHQILLLKFFLLFVTSPSRSPPRFLMSDISQILQSSSSFTAHIPLISHHCHSNESAQEGVKVLFVKVNGSID